MFCLDKAKLNAELVGTVNDRHILGLDIKAIPCTSKAASDGGFECNTD